MPSGNGSGRPSTARALDLPFLFLPVKDKFSGRVSEVVVKISPNASIWSPGAVYNASALVCPTAGVGGRAVRVNRAMLVTRGSWAKVDRPT